MPRLISLQNGKRLEQNGNPTHSKALYNKEPASF